MAGSLWLAVGCGLSWAGLVWLGRGRPAWVLLGGPLALAAGWAKARWILVPRAQTNVQRILRAGDDRCVGGAFGWGSWGLVLLMMAAGFALRHSPLPRPWLGWIYLVIGTALLAAGAVSSLRARA
ncbi:MAG TPA: hypothetical protein VJS92_03950 [Candidatus Polarisedimenticolaceae bacterium]|nr:hypothetical protein [Candidatus Polarisedimenticolaceae bacterium]